MYQPYTTDLTFQGLKVARNTMRLQLWSDNPFFGENFVHKWLCHPNEECKDGCEAPAIPERLALYQSELED